MDTHTPASPAQTGADREVRVANLEAWELRDATATGDGSYTLTGYAAVYEQPTTLYDGRSLRLDEQIKRGAFSRVLGETPDVHLVVNHDMSRAVARTGVEGIGGLELREDAHGLRVFARLDSADPDVQSLYSKMTRGIVDQMSFAFTVKSDTLETSDDGEKQTELRTITEIGQLFDVSVCAQGAYPQTSASIRGRVAALEDRTPDGGGSNDPIAAADVAVGGDDVAARGVAQNRARLAAARLRCHLAVLDTPTLQENNQ